MIKANLRLETLAVLDRVVAQARVRHGHEPTVTDLAGLAGVSTGRVIELLRHRSGTVSLDTPIGDGTGCTLGDFIEDHDAAAAFEAVEQQDLASELRALVGTLPQREVEAVRMRFGLVDGDPWALRRIARVMGLSQEGARQLVGKGIARLRRTGLVSQRPNPGKAERPAGVRWTTLVVIVGTGEA